MAARAVLARALQVLLLQQMVVSAIQGSESMHDDLSIPQKLSSSTVSRSLGSDTEGEVLIVFMFCGLVLGALITHLLSRIHVTIPYTVVLFMVGIFISLIVSANEYFGRFEESVNAWKDINPELILYLFLPALLFGEAMSLNWYKVKACFYQAALLAGPGVLIGAYLMGFFLYYIFPFEWTWYLCMIFGSIVSATDPVAVVAILKELGASPKLTILIVGESLMNDGTAMVLFTLYLKLMEGSHFSGGDIIWFFIKMVICSPLFGIACGLCGVFWLSKVNNPLGPQDATIQIAITICCAYLTFYVAQYEFEISGILACCGAGLIFAFLAPPLILEPETMHTVWSFIEWTGNTLIFLLAGVIIGDNLGNKTISATDYGYLLAIFFVLFVVRCLVILMLYPGLSRIGLKCSAADAKFMCWAGLRGALAISLSLIVYGEHESLGITRDQADHIFFYVGGIAALTLLVNATTAKLTLNLLGLLDDTTKAQSASVLEVVKEGMRRSQLKDLKEFTDDNCNRFSKRKIKVEEIIMYNTILRDDTSSESNRPSTATGHSDDSFSPVVPKDVLLRHMSSRAITTDGVINKPFIEGNLLSYYRTMFLESIRRKYWKIIQEGRLPRGHMVTTTLLYSVDTALRRVSFQGGRDWEFLRKRTTQNPTVVKVLSKLSPWIPKWISSHSLSDRVETRNTYYKVYLLTSFIDAHESAQESFLKCLIGEDMDSEEELLIEQKQVLNESRQSVAGAKDALLQIDPEVVANIMIQQTSRRILTKQIESVKDLLDEGVIQGHEADILFETIQQDLKRLNRLKYNVYQQTIETVTHNRLSMLGISTKNVMMNSTDTLGKNERYERNDSL